MQYVQHRKYMMSPGIACYCMYGANLKEASAEECVECFPHPPVNVFVVIAIIDLYRRSFHILPPQEFLFYFDSRLKKLSKCYDVMEAQQWRLEKTKRLAELCTVFKAGSEHWTFLGWGRLYALKRGGRHR